MDSDLPIAKIYGRFCSCDPSRIRYVGYTAMDDVERYIRDKCSEARSNPKRPVQKWIKKHTGLEHQIRHIVLEEVAYDSRGEAERKWINHFGFDNLLNLTLGGEGIAGFAQSDFCKQETSKRFKGIPKSEDQRRKISEAQVGSLNHRYGKKHTPERLAQVRDQMQNRNPMLGKHHSEESKRKISETKKARNAERRRLG